jgi:hypothetical protein
MQVYMITKSEPPGPPTHAGWFRPRGGRWEKLVEAASNSTAYDALLAATRDRSGGELSRDGAGRNGRCTHFRL